MTDNSINNHQPPCGRLSANDNSAFMNTVQQPPGGVVKMTCFKIIKIYGKGLAWMAGRDWQSGITAPMHFI